MTGPSTVVFSDLDGTLLDHHSYDFCPALPAVQALRERGIPLILVTSKTRDEVLALREQLQHRDPFIVENGGAIYVPQGLFSDLAAPAADGLCEIMLGTPYARIREVLLELRSRNAWAFEGFGDATPAQIAAWTGLDLEAAARAKARRTSEPLRFHGDRSTLARLRQALLERGLTLIRGGRFFSAQGSVDKGMAVRTLLQHYTRLAGRRPTSIALGDSDNDLPMLRTVDIPVAIPPGDGRPAVALDHPRLLRPEAAGPAGFRDSIERVLAELDITGRS